jgi:hypothetical protein
MKAFYVHKIAISIMLLIGNIYQVIGNPQVYADSKPSEGSKERSYTFWQ